MVTAKLDLFQRRQDLVGFDIGYRQASDIFFQLGCQPARLFPGRLGNAFALDFIHILVGHSLERRGIGNVGRDLLALLVNARVNPNFQKLAGLITLASRIFQARFGVTSQGQQLSEASEGVF